MEYDDFEMIEALIQNKTIKYIEKHLEAPNFLKIPYWVYELMKKEMRNLMTNNVRLDYSKECLTYRGMIIVPTIAINNLQEIEVF